jgi:hypothetical protein
VLGLYRCRPDVLAWTCEVVCPTMAALLPIGVSDADLRAAILAAEPTARRAALALPALAALHGCEMVWAWLRAYLTDFGSGPGGSDHHRHQPDRPLRLVVRCVARPPAVRDRTRVARATLPPRGCYGNVQAKSARGSTRGVSD